MSSARCTTSAIDAERPRHRRMTTLDHPPSNGLRLKEPRLRPTSRRLSTSCTSRYCNSLEALDLSSSVSPASTTPTLASLRQSVLSHLAELEEQLSSHLDSPLCDFGIEVLKVKGEHTVEEVRAWARTGIQMLENIRTDVSSHLPDLDFDTIVAHLPDVVPDLMNDVRTHIQDLQLSSHLPDIKLSDDVRSRIDHVRSRFQDFDFETGLDYIPTLNQHLESLHTHLSSHIPSDLNSISLASGVAVWRELLDKMVDSELYRNLKSSEKAVEDMFERATNSAKEAVQRSLNGSRLIQYRDLPMEWRNNPFVAQGYRFIPLDKWPLILLSLFALHNETVNIHTHLIPFLMWLRNLIPAPSMTTTDTPLFLFTSFALLCLFSSTLWHTMAGCGVLYMMETFAKIDYVGIGWLISASVGTVVHYGLTCQEDARQFFLACCFVSGLAGTWCPFAPWFNKLENRGYRVAFFLGMAFTALAPIAYMSFLYSPRYTLEFLAPIGPSLLSYIIGLVFYVTHFPECYLSKHHRYWSWLDWLGGGSHAIWHMFIVLAISQHRQAMKQMKFGIEGVIVNGKCVI